jgi:hypothetical protein
MFKFISILIKILIFIKISYLLIMSNLYPQSFPITLLDWWIYYLIFDIWLMISIKQYETEK